MAFERFKQHLSVAGAQLVEDGWLGVTTPHRIICAEGHTTTTIPTTLSTGQGGVCKVCSGCCSLSSFEKFRVRLDELGATLLEPDWLGAATKHRIRCANGHLVSAYPNALARGQGPCRKCAGKDPEQAFTKFKDRLTSVGATLVEDRWLGSGARHQVICRNGHRCAPTPNSLANGCAVCRDCAGLKAANLAYVVANESSSRVKVGVTTDDPRNRLRAHFKDGYSEVVRLEAVRDAIALETEVLRALDAAGFEPVRGREYFSASAIGVIIDVFDRCALSQSPLSKSECADINIDAVLAYQQAAEIPA